MDLLATSTRSSMVKEAALRPVVRLVEEFPPEFLYEILEPEEMMQILLENKLRLEERTMGSSLKGSIYHLLGLLVK